MLNKPGASAITTAKPRVLWIAKMFGDDDFFCFLLVVAFLKALVGKSRVYSLSLSSFPKEWPPAGLGNLLFVVAVILESRSPGSVVIKIPERSAPGPGGPPAPLWDNTLSNCHPGRGPGIQSVY